MPWKTEKVQSTTNGHGFVVRNGVQSICFVYLDDATAKYYAKLLDEAVKDALEISISK